MIVVVQILTPVAVAVAGWGIRLIWFEIRQLRNEQKEYVTRETCRTHRENIERQLRELKAGKL